MSPGPNAPSDESVAEEPPSPELSPEELRAATLAAVRLRPGAKARVAGLALSLCGGLSVAFALLALVYVQRGEDALALGVFLGHVGAQLVTCTWLAGAVLTFDRSNQDFLQATLGMSPVRLVLLATVVGCGLWLAKPNQNALFFSLIATHLAGHGIEGFVLRRLRLEREAAA